ncbi:ABC transporter substrate-binding protein [Bacillus tuaregi]|uniref:ABC transporter substrate-binding protein n=1 Tax=Bacillus tuaregi TaxID=1816695 RepID=UPI000AF8919C|nr:ABC transporter substrate-binding protein [Bacillus tuaregi]
MNNWKKQSVALLMVFFLILSGCSNNEESKKKDEKGNDNQAVVSVLDKDWETIVEDAKGSTVHFYLWGGDEGVNRYIDEYIAPQLKEEYNITLKRQPMDAVEFINKLVVEKQSGKEDGVMDVLWINGENFKTAKEKDLLLGPITAALPNYQQYVDKDSPDVQYDFGYPTEGYEAPWGKVQFVFTYDSSKVKNPPSSLAELEKWVKANPGKFTYPAPPDFTGSAFIRHILNETSEDYSAFLDVFDQDLIEQEAEEVWKALNRMKPYLWREGSSYPQSLAQLDQLYKNGEVWMTMGYDEAGTSNYMTSGEFPKSSKTFVLDKGTLTNTHFLAIPYNAPHQDAAMVVINHLLSPDAQLKKMELEYWGENTALAVNRLPEDMKQRLEEIDRGPATLPEQELSEHRLPEMSAQYVEWLERGWIDNVANQ